MNTRWLSVALCPILLTACQGPPPVSPAAQRAPLAQTGRAEQDAALLKQVDALKEQLKENPMSHEVKVALGQLYYSNERYLEAARMFRQALDEDERDDRVRQLLGNCMFFVGNPDLALQLHEEVLTRKPDDPDSLFLVGAILWESRQQDRQALKRVDEVWSRFLALQPTHPRRAELEQQLERVRTALKGEAVRETARSARTAVPADSGLGRAKETRGDAAAPTTTDAPAVEKLRVEAREALEQKRFAQAQMAAEQVLEQKPGDPEMGVVVARVLVQTGQNDEAIRLFGTIIQQNPRYSPAWHYLGMAYMFGNEPVRAAQTWREVQRFDPAYFASNKLDQRAQMADRMASMRGQ